MAGWCARFSTGRRLRWVADALAVMGVGARPECEMADMTAIKSV